MKAPSEEIYGKSTQGTQCRKVGLLSVGWYVEWNDIKLVCAVCLTADGRQSTSWCVRLSNVSVKSWDFYTG